MVLQQLQQKEDNYRAENPSWMDQDEAPADILKQWREARANRRMQFKIGKYRDGSWESNIRMLTGTIKVDWIQLPVEPYLEGAAPWGCTKARSCNSQYSSPMICLWKIGMQRCMAYQPSGLRLPCWVLTTFAKLLAMIFTS